MTHMATCRRHSSDGTREYHDVMLAKAIVCMRVKKSSRFGRTLAWAWLSFFGIANKPVTFSLQFNESRRTHLMKPELLIANLIISPAYLEKFGEVGNVHYAPTPEEQDQALNSTWLKNVQAVVTSSSREPRRELLDAMPNLELLCCNGVGYDKLDLAALKQRGQLMVTHSPGVVAPFVAEHALALLLATVRRIPQADSAIRHGDWMKARDQLPTILEGRMGILGLGGIGGQIARRAAAAFDMTVAYHGRHRQPDVPYQYCESPEQLAEVSDFLIIASTGDASTQHIVDANVLRALGPTGYLINVARGSIVDTTALIAALGKNQIAGAGLDVIEGEPNVPQELLSLPNVVITPHLGGRSTRAQSALLDLVIKNLEAHFSGRPVLTPIPEWKEDSAA